MAENRKEDANTKSVQDAMPDSYAAFLVCEGWIIRRGSRHRFYPVTFIRRDTEQEAWRDADDRLRPKKMESVPPKGARG